MSRIDHFKSLKERYLDGHTILVEKEDAYSNLQGVSYFDLVPTLHKPKEYMLTWRKNPTAKDKGNLICAAWLPYGDKEAVVIDLSDPAYDDVKYFFTADLSGCRLEIGRAARPKVVHIAANVGGYENVSWDMMSPTATTEAEARLDQAADNAFGPLRHRKYSKRSGYRKATGVTVVGFCRDDQWAFYAQKRNYDRDTQVTTVVVRKIVTTKG